MENLRRYDDEKDLLARVAEGDEDAFRVLFDKYRKKIYALGMFLTRSETSSQELVQDVFMKIWEKRDKLREIDYFNAWLRTIAHNTATNYLRARAVEKLGLARLSALPAVGARFTEDAAADREYAQLLHAAIEQLPAQQKNVYMLHRQQGLPHEKIAEQLGISVFTSKKYMKLALRSIRKYLGSSVDTFVLAAIAIYLQ